MTRPSSSWIPQAHRGAPEPALVEQVLALAAAADDADGTPPLSERVRLNLRQPAAARTVDPAADPAVPSGGPSAVHPAADPAVHLFAHRPDGGLVGYAQLDPEDPGGPNAELVVHPAHRHRGIGRALVGAVLDLTIGRAADPTDPAGRNGTDAAAPTGTDPTDRNGTDPTQPTGTDAAGGPAARSAGPLRIWAHGDHPSAAALGLDLGFERSRVLWQLRRRLTGPLPRPEPPDGVTLRPFRPGIDDAAWLEVNRLAFADHPEQGRWTHEDLRVRMAEPWFDPEGFLLAVAESTGRLLGFHWTKVHPAPAGPDSGRGEPTGEVYVLGVDPGAHRGGLGRVLTLAGLCHLRDRGLRRAMLYVDESNAGAMALYTRLGFARWTADVSYQRS